MYQLLVKNVSGVGYLGSQEQHQMVTPQKGVTNKHGLHFLSYLQEARKRIRYMRH